jgi:hypothetical protein
MIKDDREILQCTIFQPEVQTSMADSENQSERDHNIMLSY